MSVFGLAKSQPAEPAQKGHVLVWPPEHFTVVYMLSIIDIGAKLAGAGAPVAFLVL